MPQAAGEELIRNNFMLQTLWIELKDSHRAFFGTLVCVDTHGNAILQDVTEYHMEPDKSPREERCMPLLMIPGKHIERVAKPRETQPRSTLRDMDVYM